MAIEFRELGVKYEVEHTWEVFYKDQRVGEHRLDFLVLDDVVIELKAIDNLQKKNRAQLGAYMRTLSKKTGMKQSGMLINFRNEGDEPTFKHVDV